MADKAVRISINTVKCTACRSCELACHCRATGGFGTESSKIKVCLDHNTGDVKIDLDASCAVCVSKQKPECVAACIPGALSVQESGAGSAGVSSNGQ